MYTMKFKNNTKEANQVCAQKMQFRDEPEGDLNALSNNAAVGSSTPSQK
jgi:hypothetical protein